MKPEATPDFVTQNLTVMLDVFCANDTTRKIIGMYHGQRTVLLLRSSADVATMEQQARENPGAPLHSQVSVAAVPAADFVRGLDDEMAQNIEQIFTDGGVPLVATTACGKRARTRGVTPLYADPAARPNVPGSRFTKGGDA